MNSQDAVQELLALLNAEQVDRALALASQLIGSAPENPTIHLLRGVAFTKTGDLNSAIACFREAVKLKPDSFDALVRLGEALRKQGRLKEAADAYAAALRLQPDNAKLKQNLVWALETSAVKAASNGDYAAAADLYGKAAPLSANDANIATMLGLSLYRSGNPAAGLKWMGEAATKIDPTRIQSLAHYAAALRTDGQPYIHVLSEILRLPSKSYKDVSTKMWAALTAGDPELAFSFHIDGLNVVAWKDLAAFYRRADLQERIAALQPLSGQMPHQNSRPLLFAGGDGVYAQIFARELISTALEKCPSCDFHFHFMNLGNFKPEEAFREFPRDRLTWTIEDMGNCNKILFSSRRWIRLAQLQYQVERTIIAVDTDSIINGDIVAALPETFDVAVYDRSDDPWLHQTVLGAFLAVRPSGRDFADFLAAYLLHFEERGLSKWFDEQLNMVAARAWFRAHVPAFTVKDCPPHMMDWTGSRPPESLIWHAKGGLKQKDLGGQ